MKLLIMDIYLDNAATTPVDSAVFKKMQPYFCEQYGNASSIYKLGEKAEQAIEKSREQIADFLKCSSDEIYFTGSASESDNWVIHGVIDKIWKRENKKPHIIISSIEHKAVIEPAKYCEENNCKKITS